MSKKVIAIICCMFLVFAMVGCGKEQAVVENEKTGTVVFKYGDNIVTRGEVYIYICTVKEKYELKYGPNVWQLTLPDDNGEQVSVVDLTRQEVIDNIVKVKTLIAHKDEYGVMLDATEEQDMRNKASEFYNGLTDEDIRDMELSEDIITTVMEENAIAQKVENKILEKNDVEISDEQARMTTFYDMYFECYSIDNDGKVIPYTEEEKKTQYENALQACSTLGTTKINDDGLDDIRKLAEYYNLKQAKEQTMSPSEILETYGQEIYDKLYSMENGDYSSVMESQYGYHVFQMEALTDHKATNEVKEKMKEETIENAIKELMDSWKNEISKEFSYPESVDMEVYDTIKINSRDN